LNAVGFEIPYVIKTFPRRQGGKYKNFSGNPSREKYLTASNSPIRRLCIGYFSKQTQISMIRSICYRRYCTTITKHYSTMTQQCQHSARGKSGLRGRFLAARMFGHKNASNEQKNATLPHVLLLFGVDWLHDLYIHICEYRSCILWQTQI